MTSSSSGRCRSTARNVESHPTASPGRRPSNRHRRPTPKRELHAASARPPLCRRLHEPQRTHLPRMSLSQPLQWKRRIVGAAVVNQHSAISVTRSRNVIRPQIEAACFVETGHYDDGIEIALWFGGLGHHKFVAVVPGSRSGSQTIRQFRFPVQWRTHTVIAGRSDRGLPLAAIRSAADPAQPNRPAAAWMDSMMLRIPLPLCLPVAFPKIAGRIWPQSHS